MNPRERKILAAALLMGMIFMVDRWALAPVRRRWDRLQGEIVDAQKEIQRDRQLLQDRIQIEKEYRLLDRTSKKEKKRGITALLEEVESLARHNGVHVIDLKPPSHLEESSRQAAVSLVLESEWAPLTRFLTAVYQSPTLLGVERCSIRRQRDDSARLQSQFVIAEVERNPIGEPE
jgi:hypothetical protein